MGKPYSDLSYLYLDSAKRQAPTRVSTVELEEAANSKVLNVDTVKSPVIIESMELLFNNGLYFLRTRSKDGSEGVAVASERAAYLYPLLKQLIIPFL